MNKPTKPQRKVRPGDVLLYKQKSNVFYFFATNSVLELSVISDKVLRFRYSQDGDFNLDFSFIIDLNLLINFCLCIEFFLFTLIVFAFLKDKRESLSNSFLIYFLYFYNSYIKKTLL